MPKNDLIYLGHMLDLAEKIIAKVKELLGLNSMETRICS